MREEAGALPQELKKEEPAARAAFLMKLLREELLFSIFRPPDNSSAVRQTEDRGDGGFIFRGF